MRIGIDLSGVDDKNEIISFLNTFYEKDVTIVSYGIPQDLNFIKNEHIEKIFLFGRSIYFRRSSKGS